MEELLAVLGFSAGASLTIGAVRLFRRGLREAAVEVTRAGLRAGDALRRIADETRKVGEEARTEVRGGQAEPASPRRRSQGRKGAKVQRIEIAT